jgi:hypothetical protein
MEQHIKFDRPKLVRFKRAYKAAIIKEEETFVFEEHEFLVDYARYLIEWMEIQLRRNGE